MLYGLRLFQSPGLTVLPSTDWSYCPLQSPLGCIGNHASQMLPFCIMSPRHGSLSRRCFLEILKNALHNLSLVPLWHLRDTHDTKVGEKRRDLLLAVSQDGTVGRYSS